MSFSNQRGYESVATAKPWRLILSPLQIIADTKIIAMMNTKLMVPGEALANAREIIRAINAFDDMKLALKAVSVSLNSDEYYKHFKDLCVTVEEAIQKAGVKS